MKSRNVLCGLSMAVVLHLEILASSAQAQNLFVESGGNILEFTPGGAQSTFASGLSPNGLAFDNAGNLFVAATGSGNIYEFTPGGARSTFASGLPYPIALAFNRAGNLFVTTYYGTIIEITPGGMNSTFASGLNRPAGLAFDSAGNLFEADGSGNIYEFTPGGTRSTFASGLSGGYLAFQPRHALAIVLSGTNVILTWPTNVTGTLQFTTNLVSPAIWNTNMPSPVVVNGQNVVTNPISGTQRFFRLTR